MTRHKTIIMFKFHAITARVKKHANFKKNFDKGFWFKYSFQIEFQFYILDKNAIA